MVYDYENKFRYYIWLKWCYCKCLREVESYGNILGPDLNPETAFRLHGAIEYSKGVASRFHSKYVLYQAYLCGGISEKSLWWCIDRMNVDEEKHRPWIL